MKMISTLEVKILYVLRKILVDGVVIVLVMATIVVYVETRIIVLVAVSVTQEIALAVAGVKEDVNLGHPMVGGYSFQPQHLKPVGIGIKVLPGRLILPVMPCWIGILLAVL